MAEVAFTVGGRKYRLACRDGDEPRLLAAAAVLDARATELNAAMGAVPEARLLLMTALTLAGGGDTAPAPAPATPPAPDLAALEAAVAAAEALAERLEAMAGGLAGDAAGA